MHTFPEIDLLKTTLDQYRPLDPAIVRNLREDLIVRWTYPSNVTAGSTPTLQERSWAGFVHHARIFTAVCEFFHKQTCDVRRICEHIINKPATPLYDAQLGGHFFAHKAREGLGA
jgi:hypothetical protein